MLTTLDYVVLVVYLIGVALFGIWAGGRQSDTKDYFQGGGQLPWWAVCFSIVATETSTLTVISVPSITYFGSAVFLQLTFGYILGRLLVSVYFLPKYFAGNLSTAYGFLGARFGDGMRASASVTFMVTRLLADGVRLFATAIPLKVIFDSVGLELSYTQIIVGIGLITIVYTYIGGIKAVVWMDVVQLILYMGGAILAIFILFGDTPANWWSDAAEAGKTTVFDWGFADGFSVWLTKPYTVISAVVAGAIFAMASHGTDQLIVQRVLSCRTLRDGQKALVTSGFIVMLQFAVFLFIGLQLWGYYGQQTLAELGLSRGDEIFPKFIIEGMPPGISGLLLAGILAAAMSTLSSSLNSLASSSVIDLYERFKAGGVDPVQSLRVGRLFTLIWGVVFIGFAIQFEDNTSPVVELGLSIASFTYGGLLGVFLLGLLNARATQRSAILAFFVTIVTMVLIIFGVWYSATEGGWTFTFYPDAAEKSARGLAGIGWPWYTAIGAALTLAVGGLLSLGQKEEVAA